MTPRLRSDFWVGALRRRVEKAGAYVAVARRGAAEAGAIFIAVNRLDGSFDLYGPAPQSVLQDEDVPDRLFFRIAEAISEEDIRTRMEREERFDPDVWLIDIEDREKRAFVAVVSEPSAEAFTAR